MANPNPWQALEVIAALPRCGRMTRAGTPCQRHIGCSVHRPKPGKRSQRTALWRERWKAIKAAPDALRARPEWQAAEIMRLPSARWRMLSAWQDWQHGDRTAWDANVARMIEIANNDRPGGPDALKLLSAVRAGSSENHLE